MIPAIRVENLGKSYRLGQTHAGSVREWIGRGVDRLLGRSHPPIASAPAPDGRTLDPDGGFWALKDVSFEVQPGEVVGIIGRNGSGKSTLLKILSRITAPTHGQVELNGRVASLLEVGTGFHPELSGRENVFLNGAILGMTRAEVRRKFDEIVAFAEVEQFIDTPVKRYSSGMYVRLAFAVAAHLEPEILIVDEVLAVGDLDYQKKCLGKMSDVAKQGRTVLLVTHNISVARSICESALQLQSGIVVGFGAAKAQIELYMQRFSTVSKVPLTARLDREGSGEARITGFQILDHLGQENLQLHAGDVWVIDIHYRSTVTTQRLGVAVSVWTAGGDKVFHVDNDMRGDDIGDPLPYGKITCHFPRMNLTAGRYYCNVMISIGKTIADHVYRVLEFEVLDGDYYGVGRPATAVGGTVIVDHNWQGGRASMAALSL